MAFRPNPGARDSGKFAKIPIAMLAAAAHVAKNTPDIGSPVPSVPRIAGLTKII
jgi:hypothetical protein